MNPRFTDPQVLHENVVDFLSRVERRMIPYVEHKEAKQVIPESRTKRVKKLLGMYTQILNKYNYILEDFGQEDMFSSILYRIYPYFPKIVDRCVQNFINQGVFVPILMENTRAGQAYVHQETRRRKGSRKTSSRSSSPRSIRKGSR
jgi:hypothetical protein